jgi:hypothetical protein
MKQFEYSKKSWHFRLANTYGDLRTQVDWEYDEVGNCTGHKSYYDGDLCTYIQQMVKGLVKIVVFGGFSLIPLLTLAYALVYLAACISTGTWIELNKGADTHVIIGLVLWVMILAFTTLGVCLYAHARYREKHPKPEKVVEVKVSKEPGFSKLAYAKFKDKTCARILVK